jgi:hypothetical protein
MTAVCHCKHCQRQSGSAFSIIVAVPKGSLKFTGRSLSQFNDIGASGQPVIRRFCPDCGSPIVSEVATTPMLDWVKAGTLDDTAWLKPAVNIWCDHAQPWVTLSDALPRVPRNPPPRA